MRRLALLLLVACQSEEGADPSPDASTLPSESLRQGAFGLDLEVDGALMRGNTLTFTVTGAGKGQRVFFVGSPKLAAGGYCPPVLGGLCVHLDNPRTLGTAVADSAGRAQIAVTIPRIGPDHWWFQAAAARPYAATSDVVARYVKKHGEFQPVVFQSVYVTGGVIEGHLMEAGAWADVSNYIDRPWACYVRTPLTAAPVHATVPCPGCEYTWRIELDDAFEEVEQDAECTSYFGYDALFFDSMMGPIMSGGTELDGGWAGFAGGSEWGVDLDHYDAAAGTYYPVAQIYSASAGAWWVLGPIAHVTHATFDEYVVGLGYSGGFSY